MSFFGEPESWVLVSFILFLALLVYLKVPGMVAKMLDDRSAKISKELDDARKLPAPEEPVDVAAVEDVTCPGGVYGSYAESLLAEDLELFPGACAVSGDAAPGAEGYRYGSDIW